MDNIIGFHKLYIAHTVGLASEDLDLDIFVDLYFTQFKGSYKKTTEADKQGAFYLHQVSVEVPKFRVEIETFLAQYINTPCIVYIILHNGDTIKIGTTKMPFFFESDLNTGQAPGDSHSYVLKGKAQQLLPLNFGVTLATPKPPKDNGEIGQNLFQAAKLILSVRKVNQAYTGAALRIRRSSDQQEQDIFFLPNGELDTQSVYQFEPEGAVFVSKWYDQSGNGHHFVQSTDIYQPQLSLEIDQNYLLFHLQNIRYMTCPTTPYTGKQPRLMLACSQGYSRNSLFFINTSWLNYLDFSFNLNKSYQSFNNFYTQAGININRIYPKEITTFAYNGSANAVNFFLNKEKYTLSPATDGQTINDLSWMQLSLNTKSQEIIALDGNKTENEIKSCITNMMNYFQI